MKKLLTIVLAITSAIATGATVPAETYFVSPEGSDTNTGMSEMQPFQMVQHAIDQMNSGDTLVVLDGVYTGTLKLKSGIFIRAKNPRKVIFSGAQRLQGKFEKHSGDIYKIHIGMEPKQVFYQNKPMTWARWPNMQWSENWNRSKKWASGSAGMGTLNHKAFADLKDLDLTDGYCFIRYAKGNSCYSRAIKGFDGTTMLWDDTNFYNRLFTGEDGKRGRMAIAEGAKGVRGTFFLAGALDLLDDEGEWFAKDGTLYVHAPNSHAPNTNGTAGRQPNPADLLVKTNDYSIYQGDALSKVAMEGIDFFATSVKLANPANDQIVFRNSHFSYIGAEPLFVDTPNGKRASKPIHVAGSRVGFDNCLFAGAQNTALNLVGSMLYVRNCVFTENNRHGNFQSVPLFISASGTYLVSHNTFFNNCSDAIRIGFQDNYVKSRNPDVSYNNICNAGIYNSDVSGAYFPKMTQHYTEFHHNWVHNVKGNGVRLDQAGEEFTVHHNVFWSSKRGMSIEGYGKFNVYNNTSFRNKEACDLIRNVVPKAKGSNPEMVSNDTSFPPIDDWNVLNNLVQKFADSVGPSEKGPFDQSKAKGTLHPERSKSKSIPVTDRGDIQGNMTKFKPAIFTNANLSGLNFIPANRSVEGGVSSTPELVAEGVTDLGTYRGAYGYRDKAWSAGSDWMPYGIDVPTTMARSEQFAKKYGPISVIPEIRIENLPTGLLSRTTYEPPPAVDSQRPKPKKKRSKNGKPNKP
ncbi:right-handed parallel beta-helix repeat-containing protein [Neorhodopirellula lusitana]|uniref:right-handed parallel beta-helix repeat-containing protein n=1 Tax=Neorhodopirellula lusitana TaxID=445327 RepID=UPI00384D9DBC